MMTIDYTRRFFQEVHEAVAQLDKDCIGQMVELLTDVRGKDGRIFFLGVGGSAANASHAVNDFRKIAKFECYSPTDNVAELTAWVNDDGWRNCYSNWLRGSRLNARDAVFVFSVGGGSRENNISPNIVAALELAKFVGARIMGVVGRDGGYTAEVADACIVVPTISSDTETPIVESIQMLVAHLIVSHPCLKMNKAKWEETPALV
jgi:D-sedoheptulose 7-phosphate isomerase